MVKRLFLTVVLSVTIVFLGKQFDRPTKNNSNDQTYHLSTLFPIPDSVDAILKVACYDCHSNNTRYPWYAQIQPIGLWLDEHIRYGKKDMNFSEFASYRPRKQFHKMEEIEEMVREGDMPLPSYLIVHKDAVLSEEQKEMLYTWTNSVRDSMKKIHHPDSLRARR